MKRTIIFNLFVLTSVLLFGGAGCKKKPWGITEIPRGSQIGNPGNPTKPIDTSNTVPGNPDIKPGEPIPFDRDHTGIEGRPQNREMFAAYTVYFDFDSAAVKAKEKSKLESVASSFKSQPAGDLLIEGHCDERGTEGYNLTLGDKRANALREYLANLGVSADRIHTVSFGEAKPAELGHDESAWSKNRRGVFVFIEPAK